MISTQTDKYNYSHLRVYGILSCRFTVEAKPYNKC